MHGASAALFGSGLLLTGGLRWAQDGAKMAQDAIKMPPKAPRRAKIGLLACLTRIDGLQARGWPATTETFSEPDRPRANGTLSLLDVPIDSPGCVAGIGLDPNIDVELLGALSTQISEET